MTALLLVVALGPPTGVDVYLFRDEVTIRLAVFDRGDRWRAFLDHLFAHFDRDGDDLLSAAEAARLIALPLPDGKTVPPPPACDRAGFRDHYRQAGFTPVVARAEPSSERQRTLAAALFRHLDRDGGGRLSDAEKQAAPYLLRRLDADDDEVLTATELLPPGFAVAPTAAEWLGVRVSDEAAQVAPPVGDYPGGTFRVVHDPTDAAAGAREAGRFVLAQFRGAGGTVTRPQLDADPALATLADLFAPADRNGDGILTAAELEAFLALLAEGVACQTLVVAADAGRSVFSACDADGDGRLQRHELSTLAARLPAGLTAAIIPRSLVVRVGIGPVAAAFGPLRLPAVPPPLREAGTDDASAPTWFRAIDRNRDGFLSPIEFLGPPAAFRRLDRDGDGRVSLAEATTAGVTP